MADSRIPGLPTTTDTVSGFSFIMDKGGASAVAVPYEDIIPTEEWVECVLLTDPGNLTGTEYFIVKRIGNVIQYQGKHRYSDNVGGLIRWALPSWAVPTDDTLLLSSFNQSHALLQTTPATSSEYDRQDLFFKKDDVTYGDYVLITVNFTQAGFTFPNTSSGNDFYSYGTYLV